MTQLIKRRLDQINGYINCGREEDEYCLTQDGIGMFVFLDRKIYHEKIRCCFFL